VLIYFNESADDDNTGNEGGNTGNEGEGEGDNTGNEGDNTGNEGEGGNTGGEGATEEVKMSTDKDNYGAIEDEMFCITGKTFNGTVTLDESVAGTYGQYYFENVTFNNTIKVKEDLTLYFVNVNFNATPAISWENSDPSSRQIMIHDCYVNGTKITKSNAKDYFKSASYIDAK
jgi:hypothetical protein